MKRKTKINSVAPLIAMMTGLAMTTITSSAQDTLLSNDFETGTLQGWTAFGSSGLSTSPNPVVAGTYSMVETRDGGSYLELTNPLPLGSKLYSSVTFQFKFMWNGGSSTRRLYVSYAADGVNFNQLAYVTWAQSGSVNNQVATSSLTLTEGSGITVSNMQGPGGYTGAPLNDTAKFRFEFADSGGSAGPVYIDDVVITASPSFSGSYWDTDGATAGSGIDDTPDGTWGIDPFWSPSGDGDVATGAWVPGEVAVFSAGSDATGAYTVTVDSTQDIGGLSFKDGTPLLTGGTLNMTSDSFAFVASGLTATVASAISDDAGSRVLTRTGPGTLVLSGSNAGASGSMNLNSGITRFDSPASIIGTGENLTINSSGILAFGGSFDATSIQNALNDRIVTSSAGTIAVDGNLTADFDFGTAGLSAAYLGAIADTTYTGLLTPDGTTYRLGGAGGKLTLTDTSGMDEASPTLQVLGAVEISGNITAVTGTLTKQNSGTLILSGANSYSANTTASGGTLRLAGSNSAATQTTINAATVQLASASNGGLASGQITMNNNSARLQAVDDDRAISNSVLLNASPTISGSQSLTINGDLTINNNRELYNNIDAAGKELKLAGQVNLSNDNTARTLTLRSNINSSNIRYNVTGNIVNGGTGAGNVTLRAAFRDNEPFYFSGTNTYSGKTEVYNGTLFIQGTQALSPNTYVRLNHTSGDNGKIWLLDDTSGTITLPNAFDFDTNNSTGNHTIFVGNNNTANGGTSSSTTTGSTFVIPSLTSFDVNSDTTYQEVNLLGANDYSLRIDNFELNNLTNRSAGNTTETRLNPTTANVSIGDITMDAGNVLANDGVPLLVLDGSGTDNEVTGVISDASDALTTGQPLPLAKRDSSIWTLSGANSYTGATTITGGSLLVNGSLDSASAVTVTGGTLGGTGTIGGSVTVAAAGNVAPGASVGILSIGGALDISAMAGGAGLLDFELGTLASSDKIAVTGALTIGTDLLGLSDFNLTNLGGLQNGTYTLISSTGLGGGTVDPADKDGMLGPATIELKTSGNDIVLTVSGLGGGSPYDTWAGTFGSLSDPTASLDFDKGGLSTGIEWVVEGDPTDGSDDASVTPVLDNTSDPDFLIFTYRRSDAANADTNTAIEVEYGTNLTGWNTAVAGADILISATDDGAAVGVDLVEVKIRRSAFAVGGKLFARLNVVVTP